MLIVGEVHTGLLRGRGPVARDVARDLVDLVSGDPVLISERPRASVHSPGKPFGVDCLIVPDPSGRQVRGIGTVIQRAAITDGHVLQGSAYAALAPAAQSTRMPWSHYLARPGTVETVGRTRWTELAGSLAASRPAGTALDLGGIASQAADRVQRNVRAAGAPRLRAARTRLRWVAEAEQADGPPTGIRFTVHGEETRVLRFTASPAAEAGRLAAVAEDVALHDWLLTVLLEVLRKAAIGVLPRTEALQRLLPAIDYLMHLWLPGVHGDALSDRLWSGLEKRVGFSRQWDLLVNRIRDQLSVGAVAALSAAAQR